MAKLRLRRPGTVREVLDDLGFTADEIDAAEAAGTAELLAIDAVVLPRKAKWTIDEIATKLGVDATAVRDIWRALGFVEPAADERDLSKRDLALLKTLTSLTNDGLTDPDLALQVARVIGISLANVATAVVDVTASRAEERRDTDADSEPAEARDEASSFAVRAGELLPFMSEVIDYSFRRHLRAAARRRVVLASSVDGERQVVGFADLARFSDLSLHLGKRELAEVVGRFDAIVHDVVVRHDGRLVKMIGDAAMFSVVDPAQAALIALELNERVGAEPQLHGLRIGMAHGTALARDGDLYGGVVNVASRLAEIGRAGAINVSQELRDSLAGDGRFELRSLGQRNLRHMGGARVYRLRPRRGLPRPTV